jgi:cytidylate kinase
MNEPSALQTYFRQHFLKEDTRVSYPFVTISRQAGAGGHELARELVRQMDQTPQSEGFRGWHIFDIAAYEGLAHDPELQLYLKKLSDEEYHSELTDMIYETVNRLPAQYVAYKKLFAVMRSLAAIGKVILIGRAGSCVTSNVQGGIHVRLVAPEHLRCERIMKQLNLGRDAAMALMRERDHSRAKLVSDFFNKNINDPLLYDVCWNTQTVPVMDVANYVRRMIYSRVRDNAAMAS